MKNIKKILISVCSVLTLTCSVAGITACKDKGFTANPAENEYEYKYTTNYEGENDPGIEIDGVLDEDVWQNKKWFTNAFYTDINGTMPKLAVTAFNTEYGVYMAAKVQDGNVVYSGSLDQSKNTTFEFYYYADKSDTVLGDRDYSTRHAFMMDCGGELYSTCERMKRAVVVDGVVNSGATTGATVEIFVPWSEMRIDVSDGVYPQKLFLLPAYRPILKGNTTSTQMFPVPLNPMHHIKNYYVFDDNGYTDPDAEGVIIGDASNGVAKSANWDIENLPEGKLSVTTGVEFNTIYFKDAFAENFMAETTIYPFGGPEGYAGRYAGFFLLATNGNYYTMMLDMRENRLVQASDGGNALNAFGLTTLTEAHKFWEQVTKVTVDNPDVVDGATPYESGVRFKIIKDRAKIHYFANDIYLYSETLDFVQGRVYAGLFNMNVYAEYQDYSFTALTDEELNAELNYCNIYNVEAKTTTAGGYVEASKDYALAGESIDVKIVTDSGYKVSKITCNGEDITQVVSETAYNGIYTLANINEKTEVNVEFAKIENAVTYKGLLVLTKEDAQKETVAADITLVNKTANEQRYEAVSTTNYGFEVKVEAGEYKLFVENYIGSLPITIDASVTETVEIDLSNMTSVEAEVENFACNLSGDYKEFTMGAEATNHNPHFEATATFFGGEPDGKIGFEFTAEEGKSLQFVYNKATKRFGFYNGADGASDYREYELSNNLYKSSGVITIKVIYNGNRTFEVWMNGEKVMQNTEDARFKDRFTMGWNCGAYAHSQGSGYPFEFWGTSTINLRATLKVKAYASDGSDIMEFTCETTGGYTGVPEVTEPYSLGTEIYQGASMTINENGIIAYSAQTLGAQVFDGVEIEQGADFVIYATVVRGMTAQNVGFVVGSLGADNTKHLLFQWRRGQGDFYVWKDLSGWAGHADNVFKTSIGTEEAKIALVYTDGMYYAFLNGKWVCRFGSSFDNGWGGTLNVADIIGADGKLKIGLSVAYGTAQFSEWGYSTDAAVISSYFSDEPDTPPVVNPDGSASYSEYAEVENFACNISGDYKEFTMGAEATNYNPHFEAVATFNGGDATGKIGFEFTAEDGKVLQFVYNKEANRFGFYNGAEGASDYREYDLKNNLFNATSANTIKVIYNGNRTFEVWMNGEKVLHNTTDTRFQDRFTMGWNCGAYDHSQGSGYPFEFWGTSTINDRATLKVRAYASDGSTITDFACETTGGYKG